MDIGNDITEFFEWLADFASGVQRRLAWFLSFASVAALIIAWQITSAGSPLWWNGLKTLLVLAPVLVWALIWFILGQLKEAPALAAEVAARPDLSLSGLRNQAVNKKPGLIRLFSTVRELRGSDAFETVTDTVGSVTLLANPLMMVVSFIMLVMLFLFMLVAPFLLLF